MNVPDVATKKKGLASGLVKNVVVSTARSVTPKADVVQTATADVSNVLGGMKIENTDPVSPLASIDCRRIFL